MIANGYNRVVYGKRGAYVEFEPGHFIPNTLYIPDAQKWRLDHDHAFYIEYRTNDVAFVKVYHQRRTVGYTGYKIDKCYISPTDLYINENGELKAFSVIKQC